MKNRITKDLKKMGLIPTKKKREEMQIVGWISLLILLVMFSVWGAYKYPITPGLEYLDYNLPAQHFSTIAWYDDIPECGNDPYFNFPWRGNIELTKKA